MKDGAEEELLLRVRRGDAVALAELIELNRFKLMAALERKVGAGLRSKLELEDIFQEVATRAVKDVSEVDFAEHDPAGWLYHVMDRQIIDLHRFHFEAQKRNAAREVSADQPLGGGEQRGLADWLVASMTSPSAAVSRDFRLQRVYQALERLSEDMRQAIQWRYLDNLSSQEIATRLGKTDVATRVLLSRALRKLKQALAE